MEWNTSKKLQDVFMLKDSEVTAEKYYEMLEVLPPQAMNANSFLVGEPSDHAKDASGVYRPRYALYFTVGEKFYYGGLASEDDYKAFEITK